MIAMLMAAAAGFAVTVLGTPFLIRWLRARGIGQQIRDDGPLQHPHVAKAGTPTMGGAAIVVATAVGYAAGHVRRGNVRFAEAGLALVGLVIGLGIVGFVDDYLGIRRRRNLGLRKRGKIAGQVLVSVGFGLIALKWVEVSTHVSFVRDLDLDLGSALWLGWAVFVILATSNAVNFADGIDGLAAGSAVFVFAAYGIVAFTQFRHPEVYDIIPARALDLAIVAAAMMGACAGFLWWNAIPARIFMGDTGALAIGGAIGALALLTRTHLLLPVLGGLYLIEALSVIAQVISYRGFKRRVLRMAPIHHHFEVLGWPESTVLVRFWMLAGICMAIGVGLFYADFIRFPGVRG